MAAASRKILTDGFVRKCRSVDRPAAALLQDLAERGLLADTLVVWGASSAELRCARIAEESTIRSSAATTIQELSRCGWPAAGIKPGIEYGLTDEIGYSVADNPVPIQNLHATILQLLGFDHNRFVFPAPGGLHQKLTTVMKHAEVVQGILT